MAKDEVELIGDIVSETRLFGPKGALTSVAIYLGFGVQVLLMPLSLFIPITTVLLSLVAFITFGLFWYVLAALWAPFLAFLLATSWVWIRVPFSRPFLLLPGVIVARIGWEMVSLMPFQGSKLSHIIKMGVCDSWPTSYLFYQRVKRQFEIADQRVRRVQDELEKKKQEKPNRLYKILDVGLNVTPIDLEKAYGVVRSNWLMEGDLPESKRRIQVEIVDAAYDVLSNRVMRIQYDNNDCIASVKDDSVTGREITT